MTDNVLHRWENIGACNQLRESRQRILRSYANMSNVDYSMEGPQELHHAMLECEMLRDSCIQVLEEVAKYLKTDKAPPEVEKSGKEEEVDSKVKELVKENSSKEIIAKDNLGFVGAKVEESESKAKELMPMTYNTVMKELLEVRRGSWNQVQGSTIKQTQMGMGAKDQEEERLKQKEQIRCSLPSKLRWRGSSPRTRR